jgi:hypothetical protein
MSDAGRKYFKHDCGLNDSFTNEPLKYDQA